MNERIYVCWISMNVNFLNDLFIIKIASVHFINLYTFPVNVSQSCCIKFLFEGQERAFLLMIKPTTLLFGLICSLSDGLLTYSFICCCIHIAVWVCIWVLRVLWQRCLFLLQTYWFVQGNVSNTRKRRTCRSFNRNIRSIFYV